jgi:transcriptional regulator with XRE-family HTH domain
MSQQEAADRLNYNHRKISRIEKGQRPDYHGMRAMLDQYGIPVSQWDEYMDLYAWALEQGWWTKYDLGDHGYISLEHDAYRMRTFELAYVPGLLQVEDYIRHITAAARVRRSGRSVDNQVAVRLRRQERLVGTDPLVLHAVMAEPALAKADRPQLMHIVERGRLPNVTVQVIPDRIGPHDGDNGAPSPCSTCQAGRSDRRSTWSTRPGRCTSRTLARSRWLHSPSPTCRSWRCPQTSPPSGSRRWPLSGRDRGVTLWRKSSRSNNGNNSNCVEVALAGRAARVRDSKNPSGPTVALPNWAGFLDAAKRGAFDV